MESESPLVLVPIPLPFPLLTGPGPPTLPISRKTESHWFAEPQLRLGFHGLTSGYGIQGDVLLSEY